MIYTVTPNPTLDLGGLVNELIPNEKNYVEHETKAPGGNAINAARIMQRLGAQVVATGFLGGGIGHLVEALLKQEGVKTRFVNIDGMTRVSITVSNRNTHMQTRLSFPGPMISTKEANRLFEQVVRIKSPGLVVVGGSLPPGVSPAFIQKLIRSLHARRVPTLIDVPGTVLKNVISAGPLFIKPNLVEFQELVGKKVTSVSSVVKSARKLSGKVPLICISSVEGGALLVTSKSAWFGKTPNVRVRTTVGAGDSMVGAIAACLGKHLQKGFTSQDLEAWPGDQVGDLLRWGLASAAATLETHGTELGKANRICTYYRKGQVEQID